MQPEFSPAPRPIEQAPRAELYEIAPPSPEITPESSPERSMERSPIELAPPPPPVAPVAMPVVVQPVASPAGVQPMTDPAVNPIAANDDDIIETEWVDRAKQIIIQTKDNPFAREKAIGELQRDYLMKRYGRQVGASDD